MRLKRLDLKAFGPFTGRTLEFDSRAPGLHIIFGPNEAGKSTSLRALKALLYGFPERTSDNFLHPNDQLLVGGCLQGTDGSELSFFRRKKRKADLLDPDGNPMDPGALAAFLHGTEPALFETLYGIDHRTLVEGGEDILAQQGEVGQALFAAGAGISSLKKILDSLDAEADELFKSRGTRQQINQAVKAYKELKKIVKEASLPSSKWKELKKRLQDAEDELAGLEEENRKNSAEVQRLDRLNKVIPELAELENLQNKLQVLGDVVVLPPEFQKQFQEVERDIRETRLQIDKDRGRLERIKARQDGISLNQTLLDHAEAIEDLHQRLGAYRDGLRDRSRLDGMRIAYRKDAGALIEEIKPDLRLKDADSLRPVLGRKRTIHDLCSRFEVLMQQADQAKKQKNEAKRDLEEVIKSLAALPPAGEREELEKVVRLARRAGDIDDQIGEICRDIAAGTKSCLTDLKRLGLWSGKLRQLPELTLPLQETVRRFEAEFCELDNERQQLKRDLRKTAAELTNVRVESREVSYAGEIPTEQNLEDSRHKRQEGWRILRRRWIEGEDVSREALEYEPGQPVHEAYEHHVEQADHIADRLRREAGRVTRAAALQARIEGMEETIRDLTRQEQELEKKEKVLAFQWRQEWESLDITPLSPREMLAWLADIDNLRFKVTDILNREGEAAAKDAARQKYRENLLQELKISGEREAFSGRTLAPVLIFAESVLEGIVRRNSDLDKLREKQAQIQKTLEKAQKKEADTEAARAEWEKSWDKSLAGLGLQEQVLPSQALDLLETAGSCLSKIEKTNELQSRITGIDRDIAAFNGDVRILVEKTAASDLKDLPPDQAALQLHTLLGTNLQTSRLLKKNLEESEALTEEIEKGEKTLKSLDAHMAELLNIAGCSTVEHLPEAIRKSAEYQRLQEKIAAAQSTLAKMSEGLPLEEIRRQAEEIDVDELPGRIVALKRLIDEELNPAITEILKLIGEARGELRHMDGSARAAEAAENMEQVAAGIRRLVDQYTRIKVAAMILKNEIERYREEHQDPVLQIASGYFSRLTLGSFCGLRTDVDDNGNPVLVGIRPDNSRLTVEAMSDGTRDQLYLALRLATLEWRLETSEPLPFIVDDILINFDDERSKATLEALADLGEKNQVILFTHHRRIVHEAANIKGTKPVFVYEL
ncbi:MAG: AAA family ATPase [Desulfobulbaceae bacterium]|nr:AAA family ATPase [Desulfobulbaceae bacterium]